MRQKPWKIQVEFCAIAKSFVCREGSVVINSQLGILCFLYIKRGLPHHDFYAK